MDLGFAGRRHPPESAPACDPASLPSMRIPDLLAALAAPAALLACLSAFAAAVHDPTSAAELSYLAVVATAVLTAAVAIALPAGDLRGAAVGLLLTASAALEIGRMAIGRGRASGEAPPWASLVAAALALQTLFRADRLLAPELDPRTLVGLVVLPAAGAVATGMLWRRLGHRAALAAALLLAVAPGWRVAPTLTLLALAAAVSLDANRRLAATGLVATLAAAALWRPAFGALLALAAAVLWARERPRAGLAAAAVALAGALLPWAPGSWQEAVEATALWLLLVPLAALAERRRWPSLAAALALALAGGRWLGEPAAALAPAVGLAALAVRLPDEARRLERVWAGFLLFGSALLAAYPWLRAEPVRELLARVGAAPEPHTAVVIAAVAAAGALLLARLAHRGLPAPAETAAMVAIAAALVLALPPAAIRPLGDAVVVLDRAQLSREAAVEPPAPVSELVLDSYLSNGILVEPGRPVARVVLSLEGGTRLEWRLRAGVDSGEWAIRRPDVAALPGAAAPRPWLSWVTAEGFFAQRYRSRWRSPRPLRVTAVRIELDDELPPDLALTVFGLDLRR